MKLCYNRIACKLTAQAPLADWGGSELIIRLQAGSIPAGRTESSKASNWLLNPQ